MGDNRPTSFSQSSRRRPYDLAENTIFDYAGTHHSRVLKLFESPNPHKPDSIGDKLITPEHNRLFHLRFYLPKPALTSRQPEIREVIIMFNGLNEIDRFDFYDVLGQLFAEQGIAAVLLPTPYHLNRCHHPEMSRHSKYDSPHRMLFENPMLLFHNYKQSMLDSYLLIKKLRNEDPDPADIGFYESLFARDPRISILGFSLGGLRALASFLHDPGKYHTCTIFNSGVQLRFLDTSFLKIKTGAWDNFVSRLGKQGQEQLSELAKDPHWQRFTQVYLGNDQMNYIQDLAKDSRRLLFILSGGDQIVPPEHLKDIEKKGHGLTSLTIAGVGHIPPTDPKWTYWMERVAEFIIGFDRAKHDIWSGQEIVTEVAAMLKGTLYATTLNHSDADFGSADLKLLLDSLPADRRSPLLNLFYASIAYYTNFREVLNNVLRKWAEDKSSASKTQAAGSST